VVPAHPERRREPGRVEYAHIDARGLQLRPEGREGPSRRAEPVVEYPHPDARLGAVDEGGRKRAAGLVVGDDEVLEVDHVLGRADRLEPGRIVLGPVLQEPDVVAVAQLARRDALEGALQALVPAGGREPEVHLRAAIGQARQSRRRAELGQAQEIHTATTREIGIRRLRGAPIRPWTAKISRERGVSAANVTALPQSGPRSSSQGSPERFTPC
jgi:hypothetical protein